MKIKDLIEKLREFDGETLVLVDGYEGGYQSEINCVLKRVRKYHQKWCGDYDDFYDGCGQECVQALIVER